MVWVKRHMKRDIIYILSLNQLGMEREREEGGARKKEKKKGTERKKT